MHDHMSMTRQSYSYSAYMYMYISLPPAAGPPLHAQPGYNHTR